MVGGIVGNAMLFQSGRHPAPLFGAAPAGRGAGDAEPPAVPLPAPRPVEPAPADRTIAPSAPARGEDGTATRPVPVSVPKPAPSQQDDAIGRLLSGGDKAESRVLAAQQSLWRLGFTLKPTGRLDDPTRHALATFEHDHHLPEGGGLSPRLMHELATAAGHPAR